MSLDSIINHRIDFGAFQLRAFAIFSLIEINDGLELTICSFLNPIIKAIHPQATSSYISSLTSIFYFGMLLGSLASGHLAGVYGRKRIIVIGAFAQLSFAFLFIFADSLQLILFFRFLQGFGFGFTWTLTTILFAQITPQKYRGKSLLLLNVFMSIGRLFGIAFGYIFLANNLAQTNWKLMIISASLPNLIVIIGTQLLLTQSPRFLLIHQHFDQGFDALNKMIEVNGEQNLLTYQQKQTLKQQFSPSVLHNFDTSTAIDTICSKKYLSAVIGLSLCWAFMNFSFNGQAMISALHLKNASTDIKHGLSKYFVTILGQLPSLAVALFMIDHPSFGRKKSIVIYFFGAGLFHFLFAFTHHIIMSALARFLMKCAIQSLYPVATETFDTKVRTKGFGICAGMGRIGSIVMPFVLIPLDLWHQWTVYTLFGVLSLLASLITSCMIEQTMNKSLDDTTIKQQKEQLDKELQN